MVNVHIRFLCSSNVSYCFWQIVLLTYCEQATAHICTLYSSLEILFQKVWKIFEITARKLWKNFRKIFDGLDDGDFNLRIEITTKIVQNFHASKQYLLKLCYFGSSLLHFLSPFVRSCGKITTRFLGPSSHPPSWFFHFTQTCAFYIVQICEITFRY